MKGQALDYWWYGAFCLDDVTIGFGILLVYIAEFGLILIFFFYFIESYKTIAHITIGFELDETIDVWDRELC